MYEDINYLYIFLILAIVGFIYSTYSVFQSAKARKWPKVKGKVQYSHVHEYFDHEGKSRIRVEFQYSYVVNEREYESSDVMFGFHSKDLPLQFIRGTDVDVYYNPNKPDQSVLMTGIKFYHFMAILGLLVINMYLAYLLIK